MNYRKTLVTCCLMHDRVPEGAEWMFQTAAFHGIEVLPIEGRWENYYLSKIVRAYEATKAMTEYDYVVFVDADDTLWATGLGEMHARFEDFKAPFVMSGEMFCWPFWHRHHGFTNKPFGYLNSGFYMATWPAYLRTLEAVMAMRDDGYQERGQTIRNNDQAAFWRAYVERAAPIVVDDRCVLSQCLAGLDGRWSPLCVDMEWGKRPRNKQTGTFPCTFHANGSDYKWRLRDVREMILA